MQPGTDVTFCPACGALVPSDNRFCGHCGQPLATPANNRASAPPNAVPPPGVSIPPAAPVGAPAMMQPAPAGQPPEFSQPGAPPLSPPGQPGRKRGFLSRPSERAALLVLVVIVIGGGVVSFLLVSNSARRHGLPGDVPLPDHASFVQYGEGGTGSSEEQDWTFTVAGMTVAQADSFYQGQLPKNDWQITGNSVSAANGTALIAAQKNGNAQESLQVLASSNHSGTTTLGIILVT